MGKLTPEIVKPDPLTAMLLMVSAPLPDDVTVTAFVAAVFRVTVPKATVVGLTVIAGEDDPAGETLTVKVCDAPP
jgi:hypothetical protein